MELISTNVYEFLFSGDPQSSLARVREMEDIRMSIKMRSDAVVCQAASALVASFVALLRHAIRSMREQV